MFAEDPCGNGLARESAKSGDGIVGRRMYSRGRYTSARSRARMLCSWRSRGLCSWKRWVRQRG